MNLFKENGGYSWRKILTMIAALCFAIACIGYLFNMPQLPNEYLYIIGGVFSFYFMKNAKIPFELKPKKDETTK